LVRFIHTGKIGDTATVEILRDGTRMTKQLTLGPRPEVN
jgi:S1-C subfamily serine protease